MLTMPTMPLEALPALDALPDSVEAMSGVWSLAPQGRNQLNALPPLPRLLSEEQHRAFLADFRAEYGMSEPNAAPCLYRVASDGTAVLPMAGILTWQPSWWQRYCGLLSTADYTQAVREALSDSAVTRLILRLDGPGGYTRGLDALGAALFAFGQEKPLYGLHRRGVLVGALLDGLVLPRDCRRAAVRGGVHRDGDSLDRLLQSV